MSPEHRKFTGDKRETERAPISAAVESRPSSKHPDSNEDAALGDVARLRSEREKTPAIHTSDVAADLAVIERAGAAEAAAADDLKAKSIFGSLDGVSGRGSNGSGLVASRLASGKMAEILSHMPADAGGERARRSIEAALGAAHQAVMEHKAGRPDLKEMATTADIVKLVDQGDGTFEVAYGHVGDSRIYVLDGETGRISCLTVDDGFAGQALRDKKITREQYDQVMNAPDIDALPGELKMFYQYRNMVSDVIGQNSGQPRFTTGVFKAKAGDRILLSTDGVHDNLTQDQLAEVLRAGGGVGEVIAAASQIAESGEGRAKRDDITATIIEVGGAAKERPASAAGERGEPVSPEQLGKWQQELDNAGVEMALLDDLRKTAVKLERTPTDNVMYGNVPTADVLKIGRLGGVQGIDRRLRDWKVFSLSREYQLTKHEMEQKQQEMGLSPEQLRQEVAKQQKIIDWQRQIANAARALKGGRLMGASTEALASVDERIEKGETQEQLIRTAEATAAQAKQRMDSLSAIVGAEGRLREIADQWRLVEEQRRADQARSEEEIRRSARAELDRRTVKRPEAPAKDQESGPDTPRSAAPAAKKSGLLGRLFGRSGK